MALAKLMAGEALQDLRICPQCGTKSYIRKKICINMCCKSYFMNQAPNTQSVGQRPDQCSLPQALGLAGYADGVYQAHLQAELDEIEEEEDESSPVYGLKEGTAVITEVASSDEEHIFIFFYYFRFLFSRSLSLSSSYFIIFIL